MSKEESIEHLKHRLRIREIFLDKFVLAVLLAALAFYGNMRLQQYEKTLQGELERLKSVYNLQRILDKRQIDAHENVWKAIAGFSGFVQSNMDTAWSEQFQEKFTIEVFNVQKESMVEGAYLTDKVNKELEAFFEADVAELITQWSGESGRGTLSFPALRTFMSRVNNLGGIIAKEIRAERNSERAAEG